MGNPEPWELIRAELFTKALLRQDVAYTLACKRIVELEAERAETSRENCRLRMGHKSLNKRIDDLVDGNKCSRQLFVRLVPSLRLKIAELEAEVAELTVLLQPRVALWTSAERVAELEAALDKLVQLQSHYAGILNIWDGGDRMTFKNAQAWLDRLAMLAAKETGGE